MHPGRFTVGVRPDPADLPARLEDAQALDADGLYDAALSDTAFAGMRAPGVRIETSLLERVVLAGARGWEARTCATSSCAAATSPTPTFVASRPVACESPLHVSRGRCCPTQISPTV